MKFFKTPDGKYIVVDLYRRYGVKTFFQKSFLPFKGARNFVRSLNLKNAKEWREYCNSRDKPDNIPSNPYDAYKGKGWTNMGDFLGTGNISNWDKNFLTHEGAINFVRSLNLKRNREWRKYCRSGDKPDNIPSNPDKIYKDWISWKDWFGIEFLTYKEARNFARSLNLKSNREWFKYCRSGDKPDNIPTTPQRVYKGWTSWYNFLGKKKLIYKEVKKFARSLKLKSQKEWFEYCVSGDKPDNIPSHPDTVYKDKWTNWYDFLGNKR